MMVIINKVYIYLGEEATRSFTGHEFEAMDEKTKLALLQKVCDAPSGLVFSRTDPKHKR